LHGRFYDATDSLAKYLREKMAIAKMEVMRTSPVLGVHTGSGIVGAAVLPMILMEVLI
jgi:fatty acid-binding protein DegV